MNPRVRAFASRVLAAADGVEVGADKAPTAFRIWKAGPNVTDYGTHLFTDRSAAALLSDQASRQNLYSIDVDHMSLSESAPPESHKAVGWHQLEVRSGELWAVNVEWSPEIRAGFAKSPPEWRYFSPAYDVDKATSEIVAYLNTALTNNPATHAVTALASRVRVKERTTMDPEKMKSAIAAISAAYGDDQAGCAAAIAAAFPEKKDDDKGEGGEKKEEATKASEEPAKDEPKKEATKASEDPKETKKASSDPEFLKTSAVAATKEMAVENVELHKRISVLEAKELAAERASILASRKDLPASLVKTLEKMPLELMKETIGAIPAPKVDPAAAEKVQATRGNTRGNAEGAIRASRLPKEEHEDLAARFGRETKNESIHWEGSSLVLPQITPVEARRILKERHGGSGALPARRPQLANLQDVVAHRSVREEGKV